ncbi:MAG: hypothetical protein ABGX06_02140 [Candidatus Poseidoniia archaeon]
MWMFTTEGFLSIVQHKDLPDHFQVKGRVADPLESLWPDQEIEVIGWADYRYRITITKDEGFPVLNQCIESIDYTSFKDECSNQHQYYNVLGRIWNLMYRFQDLMESNRE